MRSFEALCNTPDESFELGERIGRKLRRGDVLLLYGGLGAGKTLLTKGIVNALDYDVDDVTSPSFTLVNLYKTPELDIYHIDLWRLDDAGNAAHAVGLDEILEDERSMVIIEWADRLTDTTVPGNAFKIFIDGDGDQPRRIRVEA